MKFIWLCAKLKYNIYTLGYTVWGIGMQRAMILIFKIYKKKFLSFNANI